MKTQEEQMKFADELRELTDQYGKLSVMLDSDPANKEEIVAKIGHCI